MSAPRLLLASANAHKVGEIRAMLAEVLAATGAELVSAADFPDLKAPEETGETFTENALLKAHYYAKATGLIALADDSGLVVDALDGRPGVISARYATTPAACNDRVLAELRELDDPVRRARFVCIAALADPAGGSLTREGRVEGRITRAPRGRNGFGYDPIFELIDPPHEGRTTAELSPEDKNALSHRGRAITAIASAIAASLAAGRVEEPKP